MHLYALNPMTPRISRLALYHQILSYGQAPDLSTLLSAVVLGLFFLILGAIWYFGSCREDLRRNYKE